ncbi:LURP-one-related/scramblase family protein [Streptococcus entericus]|uniref:LURP-one-related/scramblase family protein n=1 Tax=Streptococcus entericus TaxID=155680 RepID=UPI0003642B24|nr:LURP-one-related family protein [Streptococcus entericus]
MKFVVNYAGSLVHQAFDVIDEAGKLAYKIRGNTLMFGAKTTIFNANDQELALLKQKISLTHYSYNILRDGQLIANVTKKNLSLKPKFTINGLDWSVEGKFLSREYKLFNNNGEVIAIIDRQGLLQEGAYAFELIDQTVEPVTVLAVLTAIDAALMQK